MKKNTANTELQDWHRADIVAALKKKGWSVSRLSEEAGMSKATLYTALSKDYPRGEQIIAAALEVKPEEIWAKRYATRNFKPTFPDLSNSTHK